MLLGACATIAALVLTHYERRLAELALKLSLGASGARLARDLVTELLVVAAAGSVGAAGCAWIGLRALPALSLPGGVNVGRLDLSLDWRLGAVSLVTTLTALAVAGAVPLWKATRSRLAGEVSTGPAAMTLGSLRVRRGLLALQVCATTVVLIASGLFVRTVLYSFRGAAGFDLDRTVFVRVQEKSVVTAEESVARTGDWQARGLARRAQLTAILEQLPSVHEVAGGQSPIGADALSIVRIPRTVSVAGRDEQLLVGLVSGTPNLLATLGVPLLAGRALDASDAQTQAPTPVVITRSLAERLWPAGDALGQVFSTLRLRGLVVGIAGDVAFGTLARPVAGVVVTARGDMDFSATNLVRCRPTTRRVWWPRCSSASRAGWCGWRRVTRSSASDGVVRRSRQAPASAASVAQPSIRAPDPGIGAWVEALDAYQQCRKQSRDERAPIKRPVATPTATGPSAVVTVWRTRFRRVAPSAIRTPNSRRRDCARSSTTRSSRPDARPFRGALLALYKPRPRP